MSTNFTMPGPGDPLPPGWVMTPLGPLPPPPPPLTTKLPVVWTKPTLTLAIMTGIFPPLVLLCTVLRLWIKQVSRWRWDDLFVVIGVCAMVTKIGVVWGVSGIQYNYAPPTPSAFYAMASLTVIEVFSARLSILAVIGILAPDFWTRRFILFSGVCFVIMASIMIGQLFWNCEPQFKAWPPGYIPVCLVTSTMVACQFAFSIVCDAVLILLPLKIFRQISRDKTLHRRLAAVFLASVVTTLISLIAGSFNLVHNYMGVAIAGALEGWLSLLVCSFGVLLTALLRKVWPSQFSMSNVHQSTQNRTGTGITVVTLKTTHTDPHPRSPSSYGKGAFREHKETVTGSAADDFEMDHIRKMTIYPDLEGAIEKNSVRGDEKEP